MLCSLYGEREDEVEIYAGLIGTLENLMPLNSAPMYSLKRLEAWYEYLRGRKMRRVWKRNFCEAIGDLERRPMLCLVRNGFRVWLFIDLDL